MKRRKQGLARRPLHLSESDMSSLSESRKHTVDAGAQAVISISAEGVKNLPREPAAQSTRTGLHVGSLREMGSQRKEALAWNQEPHMGKGVERWHCVLSQQFQHKIWELFYILFSGHACFKSCFQRILMYNNPFSGYRRSLASAASAKSSGPAPRMSSKRRVKLRVLWWRPPSGPGLPPSRPAGSAA